MTQVTSEILRPSALSTDMIDIWHGFMDQSRHLQRGFFSPEFAQACEEAYGDARVVVIYQDDAVVAFFPFQYQTGFPAKLGMAVRIGEGMNDNAGLIAAPGFTIEPGELLRLSGLSHLYLTHLMEDQKQLGLTAERYQTGRIIDLQPGRDTLYASLETDNRKFTRDVERIIRKLPRDNGDLIFTRHPDSPLSFIHQLIERKRAQYDRTGTGDIFELPERRKLMEILAKIDSPYCKLLCTDLTSGEHWLASHMGLLCKGTLSYWFPVYNDQFKKFKPGHILMWKTVFGEECQDIDLIDRGVGDNRAKSEMANGSQQFGDVSWSASSPKGLASKIYMSLKWRLAR